MLGLTSLDVYNSFFNITNENKIQLSKPIEKKEKRYSLEDSKIDDDNLCPEDLKDEILGPAVIDKLKQIEFEDVNVLRKILYSREQGKILLQLVTNLKILFIINI